MANYITDTLGNTISCRALKVAPNNDTIKIVTRMLDGQFSTQQIGTAACTLQISLVVEDKDELDEICESCEPILVYHYSKIYTGIITSQAITWKQIAVYGMRYEGTFQLSVSEVADR